MWDKKYTLVRIKEKTSYVVTYKKKKVVDLVVVIVKRTVVRLVKSGYLQLAYER